MDQMAARPDIPRIRWNTEIRRLPNLLNGLFIRQVQPFLDDLWTKSYPSTSTIPLSLFSLFFPAVSTFSESPID